MEQNLKYLLLLLVLFSVPLFAQEETTPLPDADSKPGKNVIDTEYKRVDGLENWKYTYDISNYPDGEYNLVIRSFDKAGNVSTADPVNIFVDSQSDLPVTSISSPSKNMRVGSDFTVIGTAADDDGIDFVEVKLDDGPFTRAEGKNFWSLFISAKSIPDGAHTLTSRATDINGVQGREVSTSFNLDKIKPEITITSHSNGEILSGRIVIKGKVFDANGVENLEYSLDGKVYNNLKLTGKKNQEERKFSLKIDTRKNDGGTEYIWFRAKDGTGSKGSSVFVYYSDNKKPEIIIKSPTEDKILNGFVTVSGIVRDEVGVKSFSYITDKEEHAIPLIPGNPYWSKTFDFRNKKSANITFTAVDLSGNIQHYKLNLKMNVKADMPSLRLLDSDDKNIIKDINPLYGYLKGIATDDDGIETIEFSIDKTEYRSVNSNGPFLIPIKDLMPGKHTVVLRAVDIFGLKGKTVKYSFNIINKPPEIFIGSYSTDNIKNEQFFDGVIFKQGKRAEIEGLVRGGEGTLEAFFKIGSRDELPLKVAGGKFSIVLPKDLEEGGHGLKLTVTDSLERTDNFSTRIYVFPKPEKNKKYKPFQNEKKDGIFIVDSRLAQNHPANISKDKPLTGYITGHTIEKKVITPAVVDPENPENSKEAVMETIVTADTIVSAKLVPGQENFKVEFSGSRFSIVPVSESGPVSFVVKIETSFGKEYTSKELYVGSDNTPPVLRLSSVGNKVLTDTLSLEGNYSDKSGIGKTNIEFSGSAASYGTSRELHNEKNSSSGVFSMKIDLLSMEEGDHFYTVTVTDVFGNSKRETIPFVIDRTAPAMTIILPEPSEAIDGMTTVTGEVSDFVNGGKLFFSGNGSDFTKLEISGDNYFSHNIDFSKETINPDNFMFKIIDRAGNVSELKPVFKVDREADRPRVSIEIPDYNATIRDDFKITGLVFDDDEVGSIFYSMDGGEFLKLEGNKYFNIPYSIKSLSDGVHTVTVKASDIGGFMSKEVDVSFVVSKAEPVSALIFPDIEDYTRQTITLKGKTYDENGIDSVYISYDNGITYNKAVLEKENDSDTGSKEPSGKVFSTVPWSYNLDTRLPGDGTHSILIKAIDKAGITGIASAIVNIDNTHPEIKLDYPREGENVAGTLVIDGKVYDGTKIKSVSAKLKALDGEEKPVILDILTDDVFKETINLKDYKPGLYNLTLTVSDYAENSTSETRNLKIIPVKERNSIDLYFPEEGKTVTSEFVVEGRINSVPVIKKAVLKIDGNIVQTTDVDPNGLFGFSLDSGDISNGEHSISVISGDAENSVVSEPRNILYRSKGPWLKVDNLISGQFVSNRPMVTGTAGYEGSTPDDKSKKIKKVEVSFDNGRSFETVKGRESWSFRLETFDLPEGENQIIIRSSLEDGQFCVKKLIVNVDETPPEIKLLVPEENKRYNNSVVLMGTAEDSNELDRVEVLIREGKKERYQVPSFIQGLYVDMHALGATYGEFGVGLSFFNDVVKLQAQIGLAPPGRFTGLVIGGKLLANVIDLPFSYFFGYDWEFFSMSVAVGANFNYFTMSEDSIAFTDKGVVLGSVLAQFEFAKFTFKDLKVFNNYSFYVEGALWFISSDIQAGVVPTYSVGTRIGIF